MPWQTPTLKTIRQNNRDYISGKTGGAPLIPNSVLRALADANAGNAYLILQYIDNLTKQLLPDTADGDWLRNRHAKLWLGGWKQATYATGVVTLSGMSGTIVPKGTQLSGLNNGKTILYETTANVVLNDLPVNVEIIATTDGIEGNIPPNSSLSLTAALPGLNGTAKVISMQGGTDEEPEDELRTRILERIRLPPMGGDADDYVAWTKSVPGVTRAWCAPCEMGPGTVTIRFMMDNLRSEQGGIPNSDDLYTVKRYLDTVRPVATKDLFVIAPEPFGIDIEIGNIGGDSATARSALEYNVAHMLKERAAPARSINGVRQEAQTIYASWVSEAISAIPEITYFDLQMNDVVMPHSGSMATLGTISYV